jgi:hypothetical protein
MDLISAPITSPHAYPQIVCFVFAFGSSGTVTVGAVAIFVCFTEKSLPQKTQIQYRGFPNLSNGKAVA